MMNTPDHGKVFLKLIKEYKARIAVLSLLVLFSSLSFFAIPYFLRPLVDGAFIGKDIGKFIRVSCVSVCLFLCGLLLKAAGDMFRNKFYTGMKSALSGRFAAKLYSFDMAYFERSQAGENVFRFADIGVLVNFICENLPVLLADSVKLLAIIAVCLYLDAGMALLLASALVLFAAQGFLLRRRTAAVYRQLWEKNAAFSAELAESFSKMMIIKALHLEPYRIARFIVTLRESISSENKSLRWNLLVSLYVSLWTAAVGAAIVFYGGMQVVRGGLSFGTYTVIMAYAALSTGVLNSVSERLLFAGKSAVSIRNVFSVLGEDNTQLPGGAAFGRFLSAKGEFCFTDVSFGYNRERAVLKGLTLRIPPASFTAFTGPSGCGKTTVINLMLRLYGPLREGRITLDGIDLENIHPFDLRRVIAIAAQQPALFNASIRENIACETGPVDEDAVVSAAVTAAAHEYIMSLPKRYDTRIGEDGCRLSQGLKQRIAIARAVYRKPYVLILDEATSSVDSQTEESIFAALKEKRRGMSTLVVSHRLSSVRGASRIFFLKDGRVAAEGAHEELLRNERAYSDFFHYQMLKENYETGERP